MLFQYRLAAKLGQPNAEQLADSLTDEQWSNWKAISIIDGWHNGWTQTAELVATITNQTNRLVVSNSAKPEETNRQQKYLSGYEVAKKMTDFKPQPKKSPQDAEKVFAARQAAKYRRANGN